MSRVAADGAGKQEFLPSRSIRNPHVQTVLASIFQRNSGLSFVRESIPTPDDDFFDVDWLRSAHTHLVVLLHGLEGNSSRPYMQGMAHELHNACYDVCAMNFRGCSGRPNKLLSSYHSGFTHDLRLFIEREHKLARYKSISLIGFSVGGNIVLKYLGEEGEQARQCIGSAMAISVPCHLASSAYVLAKKRHALYMQHFLPGMKAKLREKSIRFPGKLDLSNLWKIRTFEEFDNRFTAPLHGYADAQTYWDVNSSLSFLKNIRVPSLLVQACDDPFLSDECYPSQDQYADSLLQVEQARYGGHLGFLTRAFAQRTWIEERAVHWLEKPAG